MAAVWVLRSSRDKPLFWKMGAAWPPRAGREDHWVAWAVVHDHWKLAANSDLSHLELFDITSDVAEAKDLSASHPEIVADLLAKLREWQKSLPAEPTGEVFSKLRQEEGGGARPRGRR